MKTCETCKWFELRDPKGGYGTCFYEPPQWTVDADHHSPELGLKNRCSKWESKLERKCGNCDFFYYDPDNNEGWCRRQTPVHHLFADVDADWWCGEFRGKE